MSSRTTAFSIVIPTRNAADTLGSTLRSCLASDYDDFEVVVFDNASSDGTRELVEGLGCDRIKYFRTPQPLAMTENWNAALACASGEWVSFLGSDDGWCARTLKTLDETIGSHDVRSVGWSHSIYTWPGLVEAEQANKLSIPPFSGALERRTTPDRLRRLVAGDRLPDAPSIYYGLQHRSLIEQAQRSGPVFEGRIPDVFSAVLFAALAGECLNIAAPLTVTGLSHLSNGMAHWVRDQTGARRREFTELNSRNSLGFHPEVPDVTLVCTMVWDALFRVRDRLPGLEDIRLDPQRMGEQCLRTIFAEEPHRSAEVDAVLAYLASNGCEVPDRADVLATPPAPPPPYLPMDGRVAFTDDTMVLDAAAFGVEDVAGAAALVDDVVRLGPVLDLQREYMSGPLRSLRRDRESLMVERDGLIADRESWVRYARSLEAERDRLESEGEAQAECVATLQRAIQERDDVLTDLANRTFRGQLRRVRSRLSGGDR